MQKLVCLPFSRYLVQSHSQCSAKNIILAGVRSVTIYDPEPVTLRDLSSQVIEPIGTYSAVNMTSSVLSP